MSFKSYAINNDKKRMGFWNRHVFYSEMLYCIKTTISQYNQNLQNCTPDMNSLTNLSC